ncbi:MAG: lipopolysaccharide biosynthesis protein RfbH [Planctomycetes bacterium RBG_13_62_9]|nr:MAG: lipopolysaccharide biosynthesis protein RfbH [Planctomycetes bacterium RBG_13_62_9]
MRVEVPAQLGDDVEVVVFPHSPDCWTSEFTPGKTYVPASGKVVDGEDLNALIQASLDLWLTSGRFTEAFERQFAGFLGVKHCCLVNSGSSANLLAVSALTSPKLGDRRLRPGDEVITTACCFPTSVAPIVQNNLIPVFLDVDIGTYNIQAGAIERALSEKTKAIFVAHTLGNPRDVEKIERIARKHNLWLIEDNCDALGSRFASGLTGTFGHIATHSFYPAHHMTMGEGGAVVTSDKQLHRIIGSVRDWGRDCWCPPGKDNSCGHRFSRQFGALPDGYDHKYVYSHLGYNLKATDMQAAIGLSQLKKLPQFVARRKENWQRLHDGLSRHGEHLILPQATPSSEPSWFGFVVSVRPESPFSRNDIISYLETHNVGTRMLFAGNVLRQPAFTENIVNYRIHGGLENTDFVMANTFWIGVHQGLGPAQIDYVIEQFDSFFGTVRSPGGADRLVCRYSSDGADYPTCAAQDDGAHGQTSLPVPPGEDRSQRGRVHP